MERRLAITYAVSATATLCTACIAVATVSGGLFVQAAPAMKVGVKQVENIDDYIVVHSARTTPPTVTSAATVAKAYIVAPPETTASTEAPEITEAPAPVVVQAMPAVVAPPAAETEQSVSDDVEAPGPASHEDPEHTRQPSDDHTSGSGSGTHHHSDDGHDGDDHEHEGGGD